MGPIALIMGIVSLFLIVRAFQSFTGTDAAARERFNAECTVYFLIGFILLSISGAILGL